MENCKLLLAKAAASTAICLQACLDWSILRAMFLRGYFESVAVDQAWNNTENQGVCYADSTCIEHIISKIVRRTPNWTNRKMAVAITVIYCFGL